MGVDEQETVEVVAAPDQLGGSDHPRDATLALMIKRADELVGCTEGSPEEQELRTLTDAIEAYEAKRWPAGKPAGKRK